MAYLDHDLYRRLHLQEEKIYPEFRFTCSNHAQNGHSHDQKLSIRFDLLIPVHTREDNSKFEINHCITLLITIILFASLKVLVKPNGK